jgi:hypothetical protein
MNSNFVEKVSRGIYNTKSISSNLTVEQLKYCNYLIDVELNKDFVKNGIEEIDMSKYDDLFNL